LKKLIRVLYCIVVMISTHNAFVYYNLKTPQRQIPLQSPSPVQSYLMTPTSQSIQFTGIVSPPCFHPSGASFNATPVQEMTVLQTANWIKTLGRYHGWTELELYVQSFLDNSISGELLEDLTLEMLEFSLGIKNHQHQRELLSAIQYLYPKRRIRNTSQFQRSMTGIQILDSSYSNAISSAYCQSETECESEDGSTNSYLISSQSDNLDEIMQMECSDMLSESGYSLSQGSSVPSHIVSESDFTISECCTSPEEDVVMVDRETREESQSITPSKVCRPFRCRKLLLVLPRHEIEQNCCSLESIQSRFQELEIQVEVELNVTKPNTYTLVFPNYEKAEEILSRSNEIGYKITKKYPPRPNPKRPLKYKSMAELDIRAGKSLGGDIIGKLKKGVIVTVNQVKGRRARLIRERKSGVVETIGWVSLHEENGVNLLKQLGDF